MRTHVLTFFFGVTLLVLAPGCPTTPPCSASNCSGCCDAAGACQAGNGNLACGANGAQCSLCQGTQSCTFGVCGGAGAGGGTTGGGGGSGGGSGGGAGGGTGNPTVTQFCIDVINAQADLYTACGSYSPAGLAEQRAEQLARCNAGTISSAYADGRATFDATAASTCLSVLRSMTCTNSSPVGYESCYSVFRGVVALGGSCYSTSDCTAAGYCNTSMTCPGQCVARLALGQPATSDEQCPANNAQLYGGVCVARIALGQSCAPTGGVRESHACVDGATCNAADLCVTRTPTVLQANGQPCNTTGLECGLGLSCIAGVCAPYATAGSACDSVRRCQFDLNCNTANVCVAPAAVGASCGSGQGCRSGLFCNRPTGMTTGTCATRRAVDQTCTSSGFECDLALFCTASTTSMTGVCKAPYAVGAACSFGGAYQQCGEGYCTATSTAPMGVCANKKTTGASCGSSQECQSSGCTSGVCEAPAYCYDPTP